MGLEKPLWHSVVYYNEDLMKEFDLKAWVCVPREFDVFKITRSTIEALTYGNFNLKDLTLLQLDLKEKLIGKKFLLVMDNVFGLMIMMLGITLKRLFNMGLRELRF